MTAPADAIVETRRQVDELWRNADPDDLADRLAASEQALAQARLAAEDQLVADAWRLHLVTLLEAEQIAEIDVTLGELHAWCATRCEPAGQQVFDWFRGLRAILDGDPERAEALLSTSVSPREALGPLSTVRCFQGRLDELEARYVQVRRDEPAQPSHVIMLAWLWAHQDRLAAARGAVETLGSIEALPRDRDWLLRISLLAELSVLLADRPLAEQLYRTLQPYAQRIVLIGNGRGCWGSTDRPLGLLCRFLGRFDDAARHFTEKITLSAAAGAHPWLARGQLELAELLLDIAGAGPSTDSGPDEVTGTEAASESVWATDAKLANARVAQLAEAVRNAREGIAAARRLDYPVLRDLAEQLETRLLTIESSTQLPTDPAQATRNSRRSATDMVSPKVVATGTIPADPLTAHPSQSGMTEPVAMKPHITVLGGFEVVTATGERARWTSRKASELLCILVACRGRPVPRELLMEYLWPRQSPTRLRNRLAVAISTVRRTLDPGGDLDRELFVSATRDTIRLRLEHVTVDAEEFLHAAALALAAVATHSRDGQRRHAPAVADVRSNTAMELSDELRVYRGEAFADKPYAEWAAPLRDECAAMQVALLHAVIGTSESELHRAEAARQILATDPYDEEANQALVEALQDLGARGLARATRERFRSSLE